jgi:hypothetical protein
MLVKFGCDVNYKVNGSTHLQNASYFNNLEVVKMIISLGISINIINLFRN